MAAGGAPDGDRWVVGPAVIGEDLVFLRVRSGVGHSGPASGWDHATRFRLDLAGGPPTDLLHRVEDDAERLAAEVGQAILVAVATAPGAWRDLIWQHDGGPWAESWATRCAAGAGLPVEHETIRSSWGGHRTLLGLARAGAGDLRVIEELDARRIDRSVPRPMVHVVDLSDAAAADEIATLVGGWGLDTDVQPRAGGQHRLRVTARGPVALRSVVLLRSALTTMATDAGGTYDGWGVDLTGG